MKLSALRYEVTGGVATLTLDRPDSRNAVNRALCDDIVAAAAAARADAEVKLVLVRAAGPVFCAGADLKERKGMDADAIRARRLAAFAAYDAIETLPMPAIAVVQGPAVGSGCEIAACCDFVVATDRSRWGMPEIDWDITPGWGGTSRLARVAGRRKAKEWNLLGALFNAATAERYDLVNRVCAPEDLDSEVTALTEVILTKHPVTTRRTKFILNHGADIHISGALAFEVPIMPFPLEGQGIQDFTDKRAREDRRHLSKNFWQDR